MQATYLDAIRGFEGFTPRASWDYAQFSNGYGTKAKFDGEVIDKVEADRRFRAELADARAIVDKHAPDAPEGTKAALTSLTYNAGTAWTTSGLGDAVRAGDEARTRELFVQYNKAGGEVLPGLAKRRIAEAAWIGGGEIGGGATAGAQLAELASSSVAPSSMLAEQGVVGQPVPMPADRSKETAPMTDSDAALATLAATATATEARGRTLPVADDAPSALKVASTMAGLVGEARLTQLLLASQFLGAASAKDGREAAAT